MRIAINADYIEKVTVTQNGCIVSSKSTYSRCIKSMETTTTLHELDLQCLMHQPIVLKANRATKMVLKSRKIAIIGQ